MANRISLFTALTMRRFFVSMQVIMRPQCLLYWPVLKIVIACRHIGDNRIAPTLPSKSSPTFHLYLQIWFVFDASFYSTCVNANPMVAAGPGQYLPPRSEQLVSPIFTSGFWYILAYFIGNIMEVPRQTNGLGNVCMFCVPQVDLLPVLTAPLISLPATIL